MVTQSKPIAPFCSESQTFRRPPEADATTTVSDTGQGCPVPSFVAGGDYRLKTASVNRPNVFSLSRRAEFDRLSAFCLAGTLRGFRSAEALCVQAWWRSFELLQPLAGHPSVCELQD